MQSFLDTAENELTILEIFRVIFADCIGTEWALLRYVVLTRC